MRGLQPQEIELLHQGQNPHDCDALVDVPDCNTDEIVIIKLLITQGRMHLFECNYCGRETAHTTPEGLEALRIDGLIHYNTGV
jgi:hypothetical protein